MTRLLEIKAIIVGLYKRFDIYINIIGKFIISLMIIINLNKFLGHSSLFAKLYVNVLIAGLAAFLPSSWFLLMLLVVTTVQLYAVSLEVAIMMLLLMLVGYFLFARIQPKYAMLVMLVPLFYHFNIVYILPLFAGLFLGFSAIIPLLLGVVVYRFSTYLEGLIDMLSGLSVIDAATSVVSIQKQLLDKALNDEVLMITLLAFAITFVIMQFVKRLEVDNIWYITVGIGGVSMLLIFIIGNIALNGSINFIGVFLGTLLGVIVVCIMQFFRFSLDYKRAEKLQFEDDEYYYYVKTIPKIKVNPQPATKPELKKITKSAQTGAKL